jgi:GH25 family lysozyme M1 (1,4-beta-N-acetylmuramidase)
MNVVNRLSNLVVAPPASAALQTSVLVPDVSFWQDRDDTPQKIDFQKMKANGASGVIIRAGQGNWDDEDFADYWWAARGVLPRGVYWFYDSRSSPAAQAARLVALIKADMPEMEVWCDYEEVYGGPFAGWKNFAAFMAEIERLLPGVKLGVYTGYFYWLDHSPNPIKDKASFEWFAKYPLWLAWYNPNPVYVKIPKPWTSLLYWQFVAKSGKGLAYGVESLDIDLSWFNGDLADFDARYQRDPGVPVDPTPPTSVEGRLGALEASVKVIEQRLGLQ